MSNEDHLMRILVDGSDGGGGGSGGVGDYDYANDGQHHDSLLDYYSLPVGYYCC